MAEAQTVNVLLILSVIRKYLILIRYTMAAQLWLFFYGNSTKAKPYDEALIGVEEVILKLFTEV